MLLADSPEMQFMNDETPAEYWLETRRPFCNLIFLLPLLIVYESGVGFASGSRGDSIRNGADAWIRHWLHQAGIEIVWLLPVLLVGTLMAAESLLYAFVLIMLGQLTDYGFRHAPLIHLQVDGPAQHGFLIRLVTFMGAGIYEAFLFRLCLLPVTYAIFRAAMVPKGWAIAGTVITTSFIFSLAHYLGPTSDGQALAIIAEAVTRVQSSRELWFGFAFRTLAGMFFAALYFLRGFGITVGAHAAYDVFVGVVLVSEI